MTALLPWIISLLSGALGGNAAGAIFKKISLGTLWNSVVGILGGGLGGAILKMLGLGAIAGGAAAGADAGGLLDGVGGIGGLLSNIGSSGVGGGVLMAIVAFIKKAMAKS